jgi:hypothetical protein
MYFFTVIYAKKQFFPIDFQSSHGQRVDIKNKLFFIPLKELWWKESEVLALLNYWQLIWPSMINCCQINCFHSPNN